VITKVVRGWRPAGLLAYELALGQLVAAVQAPAVAAGLPTGAPAERGERGYVRHCSGWVGGGDRVLTDGEWGIAREMLDEAGIAVRGIGPR
jgi:hypothetical protein